MVDNNSENFISWKWETTRGSASITAADTQTYLFGSYDEDTRITPPSVTRGISSVHNQYLRSPALFDKASEFPVWKHPFHPVNCVPDFMFYGTVAAEIGPVGSGKSGIAISHGLLKRPFTCRWEYKGGTNPRRVQSVGNYPIGLYGRAGIDVPHFIELTMAWQKYETEDDRVALTTAPVYPETKEQPYFGLSEIKWNAEWVVGYDEYTGNDWLEVFEIEWSQTQNYSVSHPTKDTQTVFPLTYNPVEITFHAVLNQNEQWEDYIGRTVNDVAIKMTKPNDSTKYKQVWFRDLKIERVIDTHIAYDGKTLSLIQAKAPCFEVVFTHEGSNFTTYYPGVMV